jgi:hypothetical protein
LGIILYEMMFNRVIYWDRDHLREEIEIK